MRHPAPQVPLVAAIVCASFLHLQRCGAFVCEEVDHALQEADAPAMRPILLAAMFCVSSCSDCPDDTATQAGLEEACVIDTDDPALICGPLLRCNNGDTKGPTGHCSPTCVRNDDCPKPWMACDVSADVDIDICVGTP